MKERQEPITINGMKIQDAGMPYDEKQIAVYHIHGYRQYMGTCKIHLRPDCSVLKRWKPKSHRGKRLEKVIMREGINNINSIPISDWCHFCASLEKRNEIQFF